MKSELSRDFKIAPGNIRQILKGSWNSEDSVAVRQAALVRSARFYADRASELRRMAEMLNVDLDALLASESRNSPH